MEVARWMSDEVKAGVYGSDTWAGEAVPNPDPGCAFCVHEHMLTRTASCTRRTPTSTS